MRFLHRARRSRFWMRFRAEQSGGTNKSAAACPSDRPSFPPSPRAWPVTLGAADRPIGCALIISGRQQSCGASFFAKSWFGILRRQYVRRGAPRSEFIITGAKMNDDECGSRGESAAIRRDERMTIGRLTRSPAARAVVPCARRTTLGWRQRRRPQAGTAWRSGRPAPAAAR